MAFHGHQRLGEAVELFRNDLRVRKQGGEHALVEQHRALDRAHRLIDGFALRPMRPAFARHDDAKAPGFRQPVQERRVGVRLDGKPVIRRLHEIGGGDAADFLRHRHHVLPLADMLDDGIGMHDIEGIVGEFRHGAGVAGERGETGRRHDLLIEDRDVRRPADQVALVEPIFRPAADIQDAQRLVAFGKRLEHAQEMPEARRSETGRPHLDAYFIETSFFKHALPARIFLL